MSPRRFLVVAAVLSLTVFATPPPVARAEVLTEAQVVPGYGPLVLLHPEETYRPMNARAFIDGSQLRWSHGGGCGDHLVADNGQVDPELLGQGGYRHHAGTGFVVNPFDPCRHTDDEWNSAQATRPRDHGSPIGHQPEGFFLDFPNERRAGSDPDQVPVYYEFRTGHSLTFWFFYAFNEGPVHSPERADDHEGDWEHISVQLGPDNRATRVAYFQHNGHCVLNWGDVPKFRGHPVAFSAKGSHASYAWAGDYHLAPTVDDHAAEGPRWEGWRQAADVTAQRWYGYGGAWGEVGEYEATTGPMGPSRYKPGPPDDFSQPLCRQP
jgi:hypothetical protein